MDSGAGAESLLKLTFMETKSETDDPNTPKKCCCYRLGWRKGGERDVTLQASESGISPMSHQKGLHQIITGGRQIILHRKARVDQEALLNIQRAQPPQTWGNNLKAHSNVDSTDKPCRSYTFPGSLWWQGLSHR